MTDSKVIGQKPGFIECAQYVLAHFGHVFPRDGESVAALREGDFARFGLCASRKFFANLEDVRLALAMGSSVIVYVDSGEIYGNRTLEIIEDRHIGQIPDHCLVVLALEDEIVFHDPLLKESTQRVSRERFADAWRDSGFFMMAVNTFDKSSSAYKPSPVNLDDVTVPEGLDNVMEAIAENTHEVWSASRIADGWKYGPVLDQKAKTHPDLLPYAALPEGEKEYDRRTALNAIKMMIKLGYKVEKDG